MTDEEKAIDLTSKSFELEKDKVEWFLSTYKNSRMSEVHTFYNGVLVGLAECRKEVEKEDIDFCNAFCLKADKRALLEQIERMKCCDNCKHVKYDWDDQIRIGKCKTCERLSNWEMKE